MPNSTPDLSAATWRKSSYSDGPNPDSCIEVADGFDVVPVRDSKDPRAPPWSSRPRPGPRSSPT